ncbi:MAG: OmpA family protein, partial [Marivivens sp.]|nr:OmpA family protein [Marivivens sp.]
PGGDTQDSSDDVTADSGNASDNTNPTVTTLGQSGQLTVTKAFNTSTLQSPAVVGDEVTWTVTAKNTGNVLLDELSLADTLSAGGSTYTLSDATPKITASAATASSLAPGESATWTVTYTLTQADINAGELSNTATVTASTPAGSGDVTDVSDSDGATDGNGDSDPGNDPTVTTLGQSGQLTVTKTVAVGTTGYVNDGMVQDVDANGVVSEGDVVHYSFSVTNTGNVTISNITLSDTGASVSGTAIASLVPGASDTITFTATKSITQAMIETGEISNTATATGKDPQNNDVSDVSDDGIDTDASVVNESDPTVFAITPVAADDESFGNEIGQTVTVSVLSNDIYGGATPVVKLLDVSDAKQSSVTVVGEGTWSVLTDNSIQFVPENGFLGDPAPIQYVITSIERADSNSAQVFIDYLGVKTPDDLVAADDELTGQSKDNPITVSPLDNDADGESGTLDQTSLALLNDQNEKVQSLVVDGEGVWTVNVDGTVTFTPEAGFAGNAVSVRYYVENNSGLPQTAVIKILFIDPRGVVYDLETRTGIDGIELVFTDATGTALPATCFPEGQQPQRTTDGGRYQFDLAIACAGISVQEYQIRITDSLNYNAEPASEGRQTTALNPGPVSPSSDIFSVVQSDEPPVSGESPFYYTSFLLSANSKQVVNNHIPLEKVQLIPEIEEDLTEILKDDLAATMTQQSRQMSNFAAGALNRLKQRDANTCAADIADILERAPVQFATASAVILPQSAGTLDAIAGLLETCPEAAFEVAGHTDDRASDEYNLQLSRSRAASVVAALRQRGVPVDRLASAGYGESRPIADNATEEGRQLNRRVEFVPLEAQAIEMPCRDTTEVDRNIDLQANENGVSGSGDFNSETRDCAIDGWRIFSGSLSYLETDDGIAQGMFSLNYRVERFVNNDRVSGWFVGMYSAKDDITGLATGEINGFGLNGGIYGALRLQENLFADYYLGAAAGRHTFNLDFDRPLGTINVDGFYTYYALFAGGALSGEFDVSDYVIAPRVGVDLAWSPGGEADLTASRAGFEEAGSLSTGTVSGGRVFAEVSLVDLLVDQPEVLSFTPRVFCDRGIGSAETSCGFGATIEFSSENENTGETFGVALDIEGAEDSERYALTVNMGQPLFGGQLETSGGVT